MKKSVTWAILILVCFPFLFAACSKVPAGNVGVKVYLLGKSKGVDSEELGPGRYWIGFNEELYLFPTFTQNYTWTLDKNEGSPVDESITFQTSGGMNVSADVGISYSIDPKKVNLIFQKYRRGINEITGTFLRNMVRDAFVAEASIKDVEDVYGKGKAELLSNVEKRVREQVKPIGIIVERIYFVGGLRLPGKVREAIDAKLRATQKAQQVQREVMQTKAEAEKAVVQAEGDAKAILARARANAEANRLLSQSITQSLIQYEAMKKWDGILPRVSGGASPLAMFGIGDPLSEDMKMRKEATSQRNR